MIPKRIYYIWFGGAPLPQNVRKNIQTWEKTNPDFQIIQINEKNYDISQIKFAQEAYEARKWAFASDIVRLDVIYKKGGFYFDTDVELLSSLDKFRNVNSIWGLETINKIGSGLILGANKGNNDIKELLKIYNKKKFDKNNIQNLITTDIISQYFITKGLKPTNTLQILSDDAHVYPSDFFAPFHWWGGGHLTKRTVAIQEYSKSWGEDKEDIGLRRKIRLNVRHYFPRFFFLVQGLRHRNWGSN